MSDAQPAPDWWQASDGSTYIVTVSTGSAAADLAGVMIETFSVT